jgi:hypothetical protein
VEIDFNLKILFVLNVKHYIIQKSKGIQSLYINEGIKMILKAEMERELLKCDLTELLQIKKWIEKRVDEFIDYHSEQG